MADEWDDDYPTTTPAAPVVDYNDRPKKYGDNDGYKPRKYGGDNDDDDKPRRRFNRDENKENGDDDRPRRRFNRDDNGDGEDKPRRRFNRDDNGDGEDRPRRRFNRDDNGDGDGGDKPRRRFNRDEDGDGEDKPRRRFNKDENENEDGEKPKDEKPKEFYCPTEQTEDEIFDQGIKSGINFNKYDQISVNVSDNVEPGIATFAESGLRDYLLQNVERSGYARPTPIQKFAIPTILKGKDLMACAQTGSGKTAAFLLPILDTLFKENTTMVAQLTP